VPRDKFWVRAYKLDGKLAFEQYYDTYDWYENSNHLMVDSEDRVRAKYGVIRIDGLHFADDGQVVQKWRNTYTPTGALAQSFIWYDDGTAKVLVVDRQGTLEENVLTEVPSDLMPEF